MSVLMCLTAAMLMGGSVGIMQAQAPAPPFRLQFVDADAEGRMIPNAAQDGPVQITFYLEGNFPGFGNSGFDQEWRGHSFAEIPTKVYGTAASSFSGFVYERGCAVQFVAVQRLDSALRSMNIPCIPKPSIRVRAVIPNLDEAGSGGFVAEVNYEAIRKRWIEADQVEMRTIVQFKVGSFPIGEDKSLTMDLPDFGNDPTVSAHLNIGRFEIWIHSEHSGHPIGRLQMPHDPLQLGRFLPASSGYADPVVLQFTTDNRFVWE